MKSVGNQNDNFKESITLISENEPIKHLSFPLGQNFDTDDIPWKPPGREYEFGVIGLHNEIKDFYNYIIPKAEEQFVRELVVSRVKTIVFSIWPDCQVPIVKMTDKQTGLRVDISCNMLNSVRAAELIKVFMKTYPCLSYLVFLLKQFLLQRNLNEVWTGGLSSYALILMCVSFLQHTIRPGVPVDEVNLGILLVEFFELYGRHFNYMVAAIRVTDGGCYIRKEVVHQNMEHGIHPSMLCIEDPLCPGNDVGRRSYCALQIKDAFQYAYVALSSAVLPQYSILHNRTDVSILRRIIRISKKSLEYRQQIMGYAHALRLSLQFNTKLFPVLDCQESAKTQSIHVPVTQSSNAITFQRNVKSNLTNDQDGSEKPGEYSVLADELASLSTFNKIDNKVDPSVKNISILLGPHQGLEGRKRRCLRKTSPLKTNNNNQTNEGIVSTYSNAMPIISPVLRTNVSTSYSTQPLKKYANPFNLIDRANQMLFCYPDSLDVQAQYLTNTSSNYTTRLALAQKRHATSNRRFR